MAEKGLQILSKAETVLLNLNKAETVLLNLNIQSKAAHICAHMCKIIQWLGWSVCVGGVGVHEVGDVCTQLSLHGLHATCPSLSCGPLGHVSSGPWSCGAGPLIIW